MSRSTALSNTQNSIDELKMGGLIKSRLRKNGIITIKQLTDAMDNNLELKAIGPASKIVIQDALDEYDKSHRQPRLVINIKKNRDKRGDDSKMQIKTKNNSMSSTTEGTESKPAFNRYDMINLLLRLVVEKCNDKDTPKYRMEKLPKFPSLDIFYDDEFVYFRVDYINDLMVEELKGYNVLSTADPSVSSKPIYMATTYMKYNTPLYTTSSKGKYYCFSDYKFILPTKDKYIKLFINKLEATMHVKIDLTMSDKLEDEWAKFRDELQYEMVYDGGLTWESSSKALAEIWANQRKYADALKTVIDYTKKYVTLNGNYKNIEEDVVDKLKLYSLKIKDMKLKTTVSILLRDIEMDNEEDKTETPSVEAPKQEQPDQVKTLEEVLERDLCRLPDSIREDITKEILSESEEDKVETVEPAGKYSIALNGCKQIGTIAILMFSVAIEVSHKSRFDFENSIEVGTYQFTTDNIENGTLTIASDNIDKEILKKQLINLI